MFEEQLQKAGLSDKEARFYLAALRLGKSPVQLIAKEAKVNRGTAYNVIESLMEKGLISSYAEGKKQYFFAESPEKLDLLLDQQLRRVRENHQELKKILPELKKIDNKEKDKPVVRYFEGENGIRAMVEDMFDVKKGTEVFMIYPSDEIDKVFNNEDREYWRKKRIGKNMSIKGIYTKKGRDLPKIKKSSLKRIVDDKKNIMSDIAIYQDRIRIASFGSNLPGIIIYNKEAANTLRVIFKLAWDSLAEK